MPSSDRIIRTGRPTGRRPRNTLDEGAVPEVRAVLRGRGPALHVAPAAPSEGGWPSRTSELGSGRVTANGGALARSELNVDLQQARRIAEERGQAAGQAQGGEEFRRAIEAAGGLAAALEAAAPREMTIVAHAVAELSLAIAQRIVGSELRLDPGALLRALEAAVTAINGSSDVHVTLHPMTVDLVRNAWQAAHGRTHLGKRWLFDADPSLPEGGCLLRYEHGFVDAGLEAQLAEIGLVLEAAIPGYVHDALDGLNPQVPA